MSLETMTKIGTYTVGAGGISSFSFSGIPQTYTDLIVKVSARVSGSEEYATAELRMQFNSDTTAANYKYMQHWGLGAGAVGSNTGSNFFFGNIEGGGMTANVFSTSEVCIPNYAGNSFKTTIWSSTEEASATNATIVNGLTKWSNTAPITSITILSNTNSFVQYSTFTLYGVKSMRAAAGNSIKATGGAIAFDGTYVTHTFNTSGSFTPTTNLLVDYLVVAGGGSGGGGLGGGGGAGGLRSTVTATGGGGSLESRLFLASGTGYTVTVGAGGASYANGSNSVFSTITSTGGGQAGAQGSGGAAGGSGGGAGGSGGVTGGAGTANQGYAGAGTSFSAGGGGGGAGAVGAVPASNSLGGNGGAGVATSISGSSVTYAGGGGGYSQDPGTGGSGGAGGGGTGGDGTPNATAGTANSGGGGGSGNAAAGGSGIVIIRYKG